MLSDFSLIIANSIIPTDTYSMENPSSIPRPRSLTIIGYLMVVLSSISIVSSYFSLKNPQAIEIMKQTKFLSLDVQFVMLYAGLLVSVLSGVGILKGKLWAKKLYIAWSIAGSAIGLLTTPAPLLMAPGILLLVVVIYFLNTAKASAFFSAATNNEALK
jgi:hypothetical protein